MPILEIVFRSPLPIALTTFCEASSELSVLAAEPFAGRSISPR